MNGSSATGNCPINVTTHTSNGFTRCNAPTSTVLFDGNIPKLTGLDGDMWASQLLTLQTTNEARRLIIFDFTASLSRVERVEFVLFNCPEWGISVQNIGLLTASSLVDEYLVVEIFTVPSITSCDSLVRVCTSQNIVQPAIALELFPPPDSTLTHLAEVTFYGNGTCPPDTIITTPPPDTTTSGTTADMDFVTTATNTTCKLKWPFLSQLITCSTASYFFSCDKKLTFDHYKKTQKDRKLNFIVQA